MRLLSFEDNELILTDYITDVPPYAILSHTWGQDKDEVTFKNLSKGTGRDKKGYDKIKFCQAQAAADDLKYFWIDTCCINKASSAELAEAINSMFRWYRDATRCYVYLSDVSTQTSEDDSDHRQSRNRWKPSFRRSKWFTRGWTLQELLAPSSVEFFSAEGERLGCKRSLEQQIHEITSIPLSALQGRPLSQFAVDERLVWAEKRQTKREEDAAYSLLGIFDVHLPLIYGEGRKNALNRLWREVNNSHNENPFTLPSRQLSGQSDDSRQQTDTRGTNIRQLLSAPDPSTNYQKALKQRQANTGTWILNSTEFSKWKSVPSFLWLHGIAGCGKTILTSTILENVFQTTDDSQSAVVYFYFDFSDPHKQTAAQMIRSFIIQLFSLSDKIPPSMEPFILDTSSDVQRQLSLDVLMKALHEMIDKSSQVFIVVDALDECTSRTDLMTVIKQFALWNVLHVVFTSRTEWWIQSSMERLLPTENIIPIQSDVVNQDILAYVQHRLANDDGLGKWRGDAEIQQRIQDEIMRGAAGMFRWAVCQLDALQKCRNERMLHKALATLPSTLDETYSRILSSIADEDAEYAIRILRWLAFSARSLTATEVAHVVAIDTERSPAFDPKEVLQDPLEVLDICSSLIAIAGADESGHPNTPIVLLAHYTVKEYLVSERIINGPVPQFAMDASLCHNFIARSCLSYLVHFDQIGDLTKVIIKQFSLAKYAAQHWITHERAAIEDEEATTSQIVEFFSGHPRAFTAWLRIYNPDKPISGPDFERDGASFPSPLYYAARVGMTEVARRLISDKGADLNAIGGIYGNALQAASMKGHLQTVQLLLDAGSALNMPAGKYGSALNAAARLGHVQIVQLLLDKGASLHLQGGGYSNTLHAASLNGNEQVVDLLLGKYGDRDHGENDINALHAACCEGHINIVQRLLDKGVDVNAPGGQHGSALLAAMSADHEDIGIVVQVLLGHGADVNAKGGPFGNAIQAAASRGHEFVICLLLDSGASFRTFTGYFGSVVNALACGGHTQVLHSLSAREDFDLHLADHHGRTALHIAALSAKVETFKYLLGQKLDPFARDAKSDDLLTYAAIGGSVVILESCFMLGLKLEPKESRWTPLHWACRMGHINTIEYLIRKGARSTRVIMADPPAEWDPLSIGYFHGQFMGLQALSVHAKSVLGTSAHTGSQNSPPEYDDEYQSALCDGCLQDICEPRYNCLDCGDFDYCFMCKPFLECLHPNHEWMCIG